MKYPERYVWLDLARGLSALAVCAGHLRAATFLDFAELQSPTAFHWALYFVTGLGHQAVMVFFVLSGFFVGGSVLKAGVGFDATTYATARLVRLWTVLIPVLVVTAVVDLFLSAIHPEALTGAYHQQWNSGPTATDHSNSPSTFLANIFFLQTITSPVFGTNRPLWSLANEFWYYLLFPMIGTAVGLCGPARGRGARASLALLAVVILYLLPGMREGFVVWLMGVGVYVVTRRIACRRRPIALVTASAMLLAALAYSKSTWPTIQPNISSDLVIGLAFAILCVVLASWPPPGNSVIGVKVRGFSEGLSAISYSLYASHFPFVVVIALFGYGGLRLVPDFAGIARYAGWLCVLLLIGSICWYLFERHTEAIRRRVRAWHLNWTAENGRG
ncbi:acyltransferase [Ramlibacter sp. WS9]|uniref:acyltransferase family protein n=1 Tax=Ramlibacter sp. WS9 TaxID=1882741 RepID=UPI0013053B07|nr:acyltransferase [Ramlibacter sp. WS9]